ncbi:MAG: hypothetical protein P8I29_06445 [Flavobacteriales bacterium]|jgi:hypothetical protein|nr:hypothetical protein [Flavobacteriales bacterium]
MFKEIFKISDISSVCGGAIKVIGENKGTNEIGDNVRIGNENDNFFYASVIDASITQKSIEITLENFGEHEIKKGMVIYQS